jgi:hypothetical protein
VYQPLIGSDTLTIHKNEHILKVQLMHAHSHEHRSPPLDSLSRHRAGQYPAAHAAHPSSSARGKGPSGLVRVASYGSQVPNIEPVNSWALDYAGDGIYTIPPEGNVPIGAVLSYTVQPPYGHTKIVAMEWTGGSGVLSYFGTPSNQFWGNNNDFTAAVPNSPTTEVTGEWTTNPNLTFVVDAVQRTYTISIQVVYEDNSEGSATISFTSVAPTVSFNPAPTTGPVTNGISGNDEFILDGSTATQTPGITIQAKATTGEFGGSFMFMQLASPSRTYTDGTGKVFVLPVQGGGPALDNAMYVPNTQLGANS